jgi:hypothetical protein
LCFHRVPVRVFDVIIEDWGEEMRDVLMYVGGSRGWGGGEEGEEGDRRWMVCRYLGMDHRCVGGPGGAIFERQDLK